MDSTRRRWLSIWLATPAWREIAAAQEHARTAAASPTGRFQSLDASTAGEIEALAAQIIPSTGGPGAREAGVIYFIDRALSTFARDDRQAYDAGMAQVQQKRKELFPSSSTIASLSREEQITLIQSFESSSFFDLLRTHTVLGFLGDPSYGGNRERIGWSQIGFDERMSHTPPFGFYDAEAGDAASSGEKK